MVRSWAFVHIDTGGTCHLKWQGSVLTGRLQDLRPAPMHVAMAQMSISTAVMADTPYNVAIAYLNTMYNGSVYLGCVERQGTVVLSDVARTDYQLFL